MKRVDEYVSAVLQQLDLPEAQRDRIDRELRADLEAAVEYEGERAAFERMGTPEETAASIMEGLGSDARQEPAEAPAWRYGYRYGYQIRREYKSRRTIFGMPLVHYVEGGRNLKEATAKGFLAIGPCAIGVFAIGGIALGGVAFGGVALSLIAFGGVAVGLLLALGGLAAGGGLSMGGMSIGWHAYGGMAVGKKALGGFAVGQEIGMPESMLELTPYFIAGIIAIIALTVVVAVITARIRRLAR